MSWDTGAEAINMLFFHPAYPAGPGSNAPLCKSFGDEVAFTGSRPIVIIE